MDDTVLMTSQEYSKAQSMMYDDKESVENDMNDGNGDVVIIDDCPIQKLVELPTQELDNVFDIDKFEDMLNSIKTQIVYQTQPDSEDVIHSTYID
jgi:hypothetical protein